MHYSHSTRFNMLWPLLFGPQERFRCHVDLYIYICCCCQSPLFSEVAGWGSWCQRCCQVDRYLAVVRLFLCTGKREIVLPKRFLINRATLCCQRDDSVVRFLYISPSSVYKLPLPFFFLYIRRCKGTRSCCKIVLEKVNCCNIGERRD